MSIKTGCTLISYLKANHECMMGNPISDKLSSFYPVPTSGHVFMMLRSFVAAFIDKVL
jgi:hypothetical protein